MINIRKGILLKLLILRPAQLRAQALARQGREPGASDSQSQGNHRAGRHLRSLCIYVGRVSIRHAHIHQIRHNQRNQEFQNPLRRDADHGKHRVFLIFSHVGKQTYQHSCTSNRCVCNYCSFNNFACQPPVTVHSRFRKDNSRQNPRAKKTLTALSFVL